MAFVEEIMRQAKEKGTEENHYVTGHTSSTLILGKCNRILQGLLLFLKNFSHAVSCRGYTPE